MTHHPFTTRSEILGLPIGPREPDWSSILGSTLAVLSAIGTLEAGLIVKRRIERLKKRVAEPLQEGKELLQEGEKAIHEVAELGQTMSGVSHAVSSVGGVVGKGK